MRLYATFRLSRLLRITLPLNIGKARALTIPPWLALLITAAIVLAWAIVR